MTILKGVEGDHGVLILERLVTIVSFMMAPYVCHRWLSRMMVVEFICPIILCLSSSMKIFNTSTNNKIFNAMSIS